MNAVASRNIKFISHCDQGGRGDGVQVMVHRGFAYIGHGFSNGITVVDVRDPKHPKTVNFLACPPNTRAHHLQTHGDLLLAVNGPSVWTMQISEKAYFAGSSADALEGQQYTTGMLRLRPVAARGAPRGCLPAARRIGAAPHLVRRRPLRVCVGPLARIHRPHAGDRRHSRADTSRRSSANIWLPGMWSSGGETPAWPKGRRYALHHALVAGNLAYSAWRDGGLAVIDVGDPTKPALLCPPQLGSALRRQHALAAASPRPQSPGRRG